MIDFEVLDLGLVRYKGVLDQPTQTIERIKSLNERWIADEHSVGFTRVTDWEPWWDDHMPKPFNYKFYVWRKEELDPNDHYYKELCEISDGLYGGLDRAFNHYSKVLYPWAEKAVKSEEPFDGVLRYESDGGHLPAHQDLGISSRLISTVSYLNDDYEGGEIEFRHSNVKIKPEKGDVIFFPSNFLYIHEIMPILSGTRYSMPHWYHHLAKPRMSDGTE